MKDITWLESLKLRVGYGETSNQSVNPYSWGQKVKITGTVIDNTNEPVIGASVLENGTKNGMVKVTWSKTVCAP